MDSSTATDTSAIGILVGLLRDHEEFLTYRILHYAKQYGYTKYTSTLAEAWRLSIKGLTDSVVAAGKSSPNDPELELGPEPFLGEDPVARFGVVEAQRHRMRGTTLSMFLGLFKYYRQAYLDVVEEKGGKLPAPAEAAYWLGRVFDRIEIAFCTEWASSSSEQCLKELQDANRTMTNEKNAYLTVFESLLTPVILVDSAGRIVLVNRQAAELVVGAVPPGATYYAGDDSSNAGRPAALRGAPVERLYPWLPLAPTLGATHRVDVPECTYGSGGTTRTFEMRRSPLLDVSEKQVGTVIILHDITEHKALAKRLDRLAKTDGLTGSHNRRYFFDLGRQEMLRAQRYRHPLSVLIIDVDHFKHINDSSGHATGDRLLVGLVQTAASTLRTTDTLGRIGGEEFGILLPETNGQAARLAAERLRIQIGQMSLPTPNGPQSISVSIGAASLEPSDPNFEELLRRADEALYEAKRLGRNRVVVARAGSYSKSTSGIRASGTHPTSSNLSESPRRAIKRR